MEDGPATIGKLAKIGAPVLKVKEAKCTGCMSGGLVATKAYPSLEGKGERSSGPGMVGEPEKPADMQGKILEKTLKMTVARYTHSKNPLAPLD